MHIYYVNIYIYIIVYIYIIDMYISNQCHKWVIFQKEPGNTSGKVRSGQEIETEWFLRGISGLHNGGFLDVATCFSSSRTELIFSSWSQSFQDAFMALNHMGLRLKLEALNSEASMYSSFTQLTYYIEDLYSEIRNYVVIPC